MFVLNINLLFHELFFLVSRAWIWMFSALCRSGMSCPRTSTENLDMTTALLIILRKEQDIIASKDRLSKFYEQESSPKSLATFISRSCSNLQRHRKEKFRKFRHTSILLHACKQCKMTQIDTHTHTHSHIKSSTQRRDCTVILLRTTSGRDRETSDNTGNRLRIARSKILKVS